MSARRRGPLLVATVAVAAGIAAWLVATAGAHVPATFNLPLGGNTEIKSFADGTGAQAHQVFVFPKAAPLTCQGVNLNGTTVGSSATAIGFSAAYENCTLLGQKYFVFMGGCEFSINANGQVAITTAPGMNCAKEPIHIFGEKPKTCEINIYEQALTGATFSNQNSEVTVSLVLKNLAYELQNCEGGMGKYNDGEYSTGNVVLQGRADPGGLKRPISWSATVP